MKKRFLALAMVLIFCVGLMSMAALAADEDAVTAEETIEEIAVEEDTVPEEDPAAPVTDGAVATVNGTDYDSFDSAINAGTGSTVILQSDVSHESNPCMIGGTITLDLNGYTITGPNGRALFQLNSPAVLTIEDSSADGSGTITKYGRTFRLNQGVTIIINGGSFTNTGSAGQMMGPLAVEGSGVTIEINDGVFSNNYYDSYVESNGSATYTLADSLAGFRVNVASGGTATLNGIWTDSSGTEYTDATVTAADTYTFVQNVVAEESDEDAGETDEDVDDNADTDDETVDDDTSVDTGDETGGDTSDDTSEDTAEEVTGTLASVTVGGFTSITSVTITVDGVEYDLEEDTHYIYETEGEGPEATVTFYFTDELVSALPAGTYLITVSGDEGPNEDVSETAELIIDEDTVGGTADDAVSGDTESGDTESGDAESGDAESGDTESDDTESGDAESDDAESDDTESGDTESGNTDSTGSSGSSGSTGSTGSSGSSGSSGSTGSSGSSGSSGSTGSSGSGSGSDVDISDILGSITGSGSGSGSGGGSGSGSGSGSSMSDILSGLTGDYSSYGSSNSSASGESDSSASDEVATPATGDSSNIAIWCVLLALCGAALIGASVVLRKRDNG